MEKNQSGLKIWLVYLAIVSCFFLIQCRNTPVKPLQKLDSSNPEIAEEVRGLLQTNYPKVIVMGTGLCENCKIVENVIRTYHEKNTALSVGWLIYNHYEDRKTFQYFGVTVSPTTFFIDKENVIRKKMMGSFEPEEYETTLKSLHFID